MISATAAEETTTHELATWDRDHYWHSFTQMQTYDPLIISRADGVLLVTPDGKQYLDGASSLWCNALGHSHPGIKRAIAEQLERMPHCTSLGMGADTTVRLAKKLADVTPGDLQHTFFSSDGSSATEVALKIAFQYWQQADTPRPSKTKFLAFDQAYHGDTIGAVSLAGIDRYSKVFEPLLFETLHAPVPDRRRLPEASHEEAAEHFLAEAATVFEQHADELAAVVIEPLVQCAAGMAMQPKGFLSGLAKLAKQHDVLLIADEVAVGFGKTGTLFACEQEDVTPDLLCLGKGITGGYLPLAATVATPRIYNAFLGERTANGLASPRTLFHGHSFSGNPLSSAAALACLQAFEEERVLEELQPKIAKIGEHFCRLAEYPAFKQCLTNARQTGIITAIDFTPEHQVGLAFAQECFERGLWLRPQPHMFYVMPPLSITLEEIDWMMERIEESLRVVLGN